MKSRVIHTPSLSAVRYLGDFDKRLFELGGRVQPNLKADDENIIVVTELQAQLLSRNPLFEKVDINEIFVNKNESSSFDTSSLTDEQIEDFNKVTSSLEKIATFLQDKISPEELGDINESIEDKVIRLLEKTLVKHESNTTNEVLKEVIASDNQENTSKDEQNDKHEYNPPYLDDLDGLTLEEVKKACLHFNITVGNKRIETLKSLLLPCLKSKDAQ
ncbi:hypothetical protein [Aliarcobacter butzleri]|uniref:hypothetical protein n=1 Tax=Aliarcobacter butzleri TaxID=28197 RepID=UPI001587DDAD|nr:hypothetical protein [Aliarcobacter butzleri]NUW28987.1 hypothetical protein [Aliarcobacter butzleri]